MLMLVSLSGRAGTTRFAPHSPKNHPRRRRGLNSTDHCAADGLQATSHLLFLRYTERTKKPNDPDGSKRKTMKYTTMMNFHEVTINQ